MNGVNFPEHGANDGSCVFFFFGSETLRKISPKVIVRQGYDMTRSESDRSGNCRAFFFQREVTFRRFSALYTQRSALFINLVDVTPDRIFGLEVLDPFVTLFLVSGWQRALLLTLHPSFSAILSSYEFLFCSTDHDSHCPFPTLTRAFFRPATFFLLIPLF